MYHQETQVPPVLLRRTNYTVVYNESELHALLVEVNLLISESLTIGSELHHLFAWRHNGHFVDAINNMRITMESNGSLTVYPVMPSDAGSYEITAIISNELGCMDDIFNLYIESE